jgi:hypothetical protein
MNRNNSDIIYNNDKFKYQYDDLRNKTVIDIFEQVAA